MESGTWAATQDTPVPAGTATIMRDGRVLSVGSTSNVPADCPTCAVPNSAAIYVPVAATWSMTTPPY